MEPNLRESDSADEREGALKSCKVFGDLSAEHLEMIAPLCTFERFGAGEEIFSQGEKGKRLFILCKGRVELTRTMALGGQRHATVTVFRQRESPTRRLMGCWSGLVGASHVQRCTAHCTEPTTVVALSCEDLRSVLVAHPGLGMKVLERLVLLLRSRIDSSYAVMEVL